MNVKTLKNLSIASIVCAAVSLFFGGVLLDVAGLVLGIVALSKLKSAAAGADASNQASDVATVSKLSKTGIVVCAVALVLNFVSAIFLAPVLFEQISSTTTSVSNSGSVF